MSTVITDGLVEQVAQQAYRNSLLGNQPLTATQLADQFGRTEAWATDRINASPRHTPSPRTRL